MGYIDEIQHESWCEVGRQIAGMNFQTRSSLSEKCILPNMHYNLCEK